MPQQNDIEKEAKAIGKRLALLLAAADLPEDVKAGFTAMIPEMTPEQLDRLAKILEANVRDSSADQKTALALAVQKAQAVYETKREENEKKATKELDEIEAILKQAEL